MVRLNGIANSGLVHDTTIVNKSFGIILASYILSCCAVCSITSTSCRYGTFLYDWHATKRKGNINQNNRLFNLFINLLYLNIKSYPFSPIEESVLNESDALFVKAVSPICMQTLSYDLSTI